jgi:predicted RNA-binding Zn ribbon-like protein
VPSSELPLNNGPLAVNLANTLPSDRPGRDLLSTADHVRRWLAAQQPPASQEDLLAAARGRAGDALAPMRGLRALVRRLLEAETDGRAPAEQDVQALNAAASAAIGRPELIRQDGRWVRQDRPATADALDQLIALVAVDCMNVLASGRPVRRCAGPGCKLLFVGGHPRRTWCDSRTCGNRVRVARHTRRD